jgi:hypothetical protein
MTWISSPFFGASLPDSGPGLMHPMDHLGVCTGLKLGPELHLPPKIPWP